MYVCMQAIIELLPNDPFQFSQGIYDLITCYDSQYEYDLDHMKQFILFTLLPIYHKLCIENPQFSLVDINQNSFNFTHQDDLSLISINEQSLQSQQSPIHNQNNQSQLFQFLDLVQVPPQQSKCQHTLSIDYQTIALYQNEQNDNSQEIEQQLLIQQPQSVQQLKGNHQLNDFYDSLDFDLFLLKQNQKLKDKIPISSCKINEDKYHAKNQSLEFSSNGENHQIIQNTSESSPQDDMNSSYSLSPVGTIHITKQYQESIDQQSQTNENSQYVEQSDEFCDSLNFDFFLSKKNQKFNQKSSISPFKLNDDKFHEQDQLLQFSSNENNHQLHYNTPLSSWPPPLNQPDSMTQFSLPKPPVNQLDQNCPTVQLSPGFDNQLIINSISHYQLNNTSQDPHLIADENYLSISNSNFDSTNDYPQQRVQQSTNLQLRQEIRDYPSPLLTSNDFTNSERPKLLQMKEIKELSNSKLSSPYLLNQVPQQQYNITSNSQTSYALDLPSIFNRQYQITQINNQQQTPQHAYADSSHYKTSTYSQDIKLLYPYYEFQFSQSNVKHLTIEQLVQQVTPRDFDTAIEILYSIIYTYLVQNNHYQTPFTYLDIFKEITILQLENFLNASIQNSDNKVLKNNFPLSRLSELISNYIPLQHLFKDFLFKYTQRLQQYPLDIMYFHLLNMKINHELPYIPDDAKLTKSQLSPEITQITREDKLMTGRKTKYKQNTLVLSSVPDTPQKNLIPLNRKEFIQKIPILPFSKQQLLKQSIQSY